MGLLSRLLYPDGSNGYEYVDLGLSVNWATMNVGARASYECGIKVQWGHVNTRRRSRNKFAVESLHDEFRKYVTDSFYGKVDNRTRLLPHDDVAHRKMGGNWRLPTIEEVDELIQQCQWQLIEINRVIPCFKVIGSNGNHIIIPLDGDSTTCCWSSTLSSFNTDAQCLRLYKSFEPKSNSQSRNEASYARGVLPKNQ